MEYIAILTIVISALITFSPYVRKAIQGYYRQSGETFAFTRQHDPFKTRDCVWDDRIMPNGPTAPGGPAQPVGMWYSEKCFEHYIVVSGCATTTADNLGENMGRPCAELAANAPECLISWSDATSACPTSCCFTAAKVFCAGECSTMPNLNPL